MPPAPAAAAPPTSRSAVSPPPSDPWLPPPPPGTAPVGTVEVVVTGVEVVVVGVVVFDVVVVGVVVSGVVVSVSHFGFKSCANAPGAPSAQSRTIPITAQMNRPMAIFMPNPFAGKSPARFAVEQAANNAATRSNRHSTRQIQQAPARVTFYLRRSASLPIMTRIRRNVRELPELVKFRIVVEITIVWSTQPCGSDR